MSRECDMSYKIMFSYKVYILENKSLHTKLGGV